jgi:hypothetical protein
MLASVSRSAAPMDLMSAPGRMNEEELVRERKQAKTQFQELEKASEYCETHYFNNTNMNNPHTIRPNKFWADFAQHILNQGDTHKFITPNFIYACNSTVEVMTMLAILDLKFDEPNHKISIKGDKGINIDAAGNYIVFKKEIKEAEADIDTNLLSIHRFYEYNNSKSKKKLKEFLTHKIYTCEVVVTNVSTDFQSFQTLWQIPEGSLPVSNTNYQKTESKELNPYTTLTFQFHFYFPNTGKFTQFPTNITMDEKVVAAAKPCHFDVVDELTEITFEMFSDYIQSGDLSKICEFLEKNNLIDGEKGFNFYDILWLLKDKETYHKIITILKNRMIFDNQVWTYGFLHKDDETISEYFERNRQTISSYYTAFRHLDYYPLVNSRAHQMADDTNQGILNREFRQTYNKFLLSLVEKSKLSTEDLLNWTLYYLLQDKTKEAIEMFEQVDGSTLHDEDPMKIQYDYLGAYLDFFQGSATNFKVAREVAWKYADYPVLYWKGLFQEVYEQLKEYDGELDLDKKFDQSDELKKKENLKKSKNAEPILDCHLEQKNVVIDYSNVDKVDVKYYVIDPELMFSKSPFITQSADEFSYVKPLKVNTYQLDKFGKSKSVPIDEEYVNSNLIIEVIGSGKQQFISYFSTDLKVTFNETYGELKVTDQQDKPLSKVYVKVYARHIGGEVKFFRDGYTDIRGKLEYAQCSSGKLGSIEKFSVFIMSDDLGSMTKECSPPSNVKKEFYR